MVRNMVRIGPDMGVLARNSIIGEPARDARELRLAVAIVTAQPRVNVVPTVGFVELRCKDIVHAQPPRDRVHIEVEGGGREEEPIACLAIGRNLLQRCGMQSARHYLVGIALGQRGNFGTAEALADQETQVDRLELRPVDQPQRIGEPRKAHEGQQHQAPRLPPPRNVHQKAAVGARARDRAVHVVHGDAVRDRTDGRCFHIGAIAFPPLPAKSGKDVTD